MTGLFEGIRDIYHTPVICTCELPWSKLLCETYEIIHSDKVSSIPFSTNREKKDYIGWRNGISDQ